MRRIIQIAVGNPAGWNGLQGEEHFVDAEHTVFGLDSDGGLWRMVTPRGGPAKWVSVVPAGTRLPDVAVVPK